MPDFWAHKMEQFSQKSCCESEIFVLNLEHAIVNLCNNESGRL